MDGRKEEKTDGWKKGWHKVRDANGSRQAYARGGKVPYKKWRKE